MARFILSAFADEASPVFDEQLRILAEEGMSLIELRGADGRNCADLTLEEAAVIREKLDAAGVGLSALGSPFGKYPLAEPFEAHLQKFRHGLELCRILGAKRIRMFSFYPAKENAWDEAARAEVLRRLEVMLTLAEEAGVQLVHENEKGIYGDNAERNADLLSHFGSRLGFAFDPANFIQCGVKPIEVFDMLHDRITYIHIKDALMADGAVVCAGHGDGDVPQILRRLNAERDDEIILTVEPHLTVFKGLENLQDEELKHHESYPDSRTAFHAAVSALKDILADIAKEEKAC
ncbi:MAG: sugar phosphate isomerase/epimerase [Clostridia bacterium]|nr:sugar phosphate isomerase/epimerase [Clostridia bacterium]